MFSYRKTLLKMVYSEDITIFVKGISVFNKLIIDVKYFKFQNLELKVNANIYLDIHFYIIEKMECWLESHNT